MRSLTIRFFALACAVAVGSLGACRESRAPNGAPVVRAPVPTDAAPPASPWVGVFHVVDGDGAREPNLEIRADGTFSLSNDDSDMVTSVRGRWEPTADGIVLLPLAGGELMGFHFNRRTERVTAKREGAGLVLSGTDMVQSNESESHPFVEHYVRGRLCATAPVGTGSAPTAPCK